MTRGRSSLAPPLKRAEQCSGIEGVEPEMGLDEKGGDPETPGGEQHPAGASLHDEEGSAGHWSSARRYSKSRGPRSSRMVSGRIARRVRARTRL